MHSLCVALIIRVLVGSIVIKFWLGVIMKKYIKTTIISVFIFLMYRMYSTDFFVQAFDMADFSFISALKILITYSLINNIAFIVLFMYVHNFQDKISDRLWEKIAALVFGLCFMGGNSVTTVGAFAEKFYSKRMLIFYTLYLLGIYFAFRLVLYHLRELICKIVNYRLDYRFTDKQQFVTTFIFITICWLPYVILRYPAGFEMDAYFQIADFLEGTMTAHWPPASSAWMGIFVLFGQKLFDSSDIGIFVYCIVQLILGSAIFSYCLVVMRRFEAPPLWTYISLIVFALVPAYPGYITSVVKDAPFAYMVTLFVLLFVQCIYMNISNIRLIGLFISGILMCILRNNGIFILFGIVLGLIIAMIVKRKLVHLMVLIICILQIIFTITYSSVILPSLDIAATSEAEALSVPFQQTARLASMYPDEITDDEATIISNVLDLDVIASEYEPGLSDKVKATYHSDDKTELMAYFLVWFKEGIRRPDVYIDAFLLNSVGFIYPDVRLSNSPVVSGVYSQVYNLREVQFDASYSDILKREKLKQKVSLIENIPVVFPFVNSAIQLWIPVLILLWAISKKDGKLLLMLIPSVIGILVCLASPTYLNNGARYALPVLYTNMFMIAMCIRHSNGIRC